MLKFSDYLTESLELNEAQLKYDIEKKYQYYNKLLFDGKLPSNFKMRFSRTKKAGGAVLTNYWTTGRGRYKKVTRYEIDELYLSTFYLRTEEQLDSILVHEMIHVYLTVNGMHEGYNVKYHGPEFVSKMGELQQKVPFKISLYDTPDMRGEVSIKSTKNEIGVVMTVINGKPDSISTFTKKALLDNKEKIKEMLLKNLEDGTEIILGTSSNPQLEQYKIKRTVSKFSLYILDDELYDNIKKDFNEIERVKKDGKVSDEMIQKKKTDELFKVEMRLMASSPGKKQEQLKVQVNSLRKELGMELRQW
jgi:hypothetical protein